MPQAVTRLEPGGLLAFRLHLTADDFDSPTSAFILVSHTVSACFPCLPSHPLFPVPVQINIFTLFPHLLFMCLGMGIVNRWIPDCS